MRWLVSGRVPLWKCAALVACQVRLAKSSLAFISNTSCSKPLLQSPSSIVRAMSTSSSNDEVQKAILMAAEFQKMDSDAPTIFDKIVAGDIPSKKVYEDDLILAFRDINPQAPVHILLIPKQRQGLSKLSQAVEGHTALLGHLMFVASKVGREECPNGFRLVINDGEDGAQSVYHLHVHILGGRQMAWPPG